MLSNIGSVSQEICTPLKEIMKPDPAVITEDCSVLEAAQKMKEIDAGVLPVVEGNKMNETRHPIGVVTDRDITIRATAEAKDPETTRIGEVFTADTVCCYEDDTAEEAFEKMRENDVGRLLVINHEDDLVGIVSLADIWEHVGASRELDGSSSDALSRQ